MAEQIHQHDIFLDKITIRGGAVPVDIKPMVKEVSIFESIWYPFLTGLVAISDSHDLHGKLHNLSDTNTVDIKFGMTGLEGKGPDELIGVSPPPFHIVTETGRFKKTSGAEGYTLELVSESYRNAIDTRISKTYKDMTISDMVKNIFKEHWGDATTDKDRKKVKLVLTETLTADTLTIPNLNPLEAILWLGGRAVDKEGGVNFTFFERMDGHYWASINHLLANIDNDDETKGTIAKLVYKPSKVDDSTGLGHGKENIIVIKEFQIQKMANNQKKIKDGVYASKMITHDITTKKIKETTYSLYEDWTKLNHCGAKTPTTNAEVETVAAGKPRQSFAPSTADSDKKTSKRLGDQVDTNIVYYPKHKQLHCATSTNDYDNNVEKWKLQRKGHTEIFTNTMQLTVEISGHSALRCGMVVWIEIPASESTDADKKTDRLYNTMFTGLWLITAIKHTIKGLGQAGESLGYHMIVEVTKDGIPDCFADRPSRKEE